VYLKMVMVRAVTYSALRIQIVIKYILTLVSETLLDHTLHLP